MLSQEIKNKVQLLWDRLWAEGLSNPITAIDNISYLNIYETLKSYNNNSNFVKEYFKSNELVIYDFNAITNSIRSFRKENKLESHIKNVRNIIAGHIDKDFKEYFEIVNSISTEETIKTGMEFMDILHQLMAFLVKVTPKLKNV